MSIRYPAPEDDKPQIGDTAKRIIVLAFGTLLAVVAVASAIGREFGFAALFGTPALILLGIGGWAGRRSVSASAKTVTEIGNLIS